VPSERTLRLAAAVLAVCGIGVAAYITIADAGGGAPACLAGGHGCETVANSRYSHLAGINVAVLGWPPSASTAVAMATTCSAQFGAAAEIVGCMEGWAILDSNQGPPPYQRGALTD
jgi:hypothetical protein